jgi:hypothetical protein
LFAGALAKPAKNDQAIKTRRKATRCDQVTASSRAAICPNCNSSSNNANAARCQCGPRLRLSVIRSRRATLQPLPHPRSPDAIPEERDRTMDLHLTDEQVELLVTELDQIIDGDPYFLSPRIAALAAQAAAVPPQRIYAVKLRS